MPVDRGAYVSIRKVLFRGPDFQKLSAPARSTFIALKANTSGMAGIDVAYPDELEIRLAGYTGEPVKRIRSALGELEQSGWVRREGNLVWVVGHLQHDPHAHVTDAKKRKSVQTWVAGLPRLPLVREYVANNANWFPESDCADLLDSLETVCEDSPETVRTTIDNRQETRDKNQQTDAASRAAGSKGGYSPEFLELWSLYPQRSGSNPKDKAAAAINARLREGVEIEHLKAKTAEYHRWAEATGKVGTEKIMQASRFYGPAREYETGNWLPPAALEQDSTRGAYEPLTTRPATMGRVI